MGTWHDKEHQKFFLTRPHAKSRSKKARPEAAPASSKNAYTKKLSLYIQNNKLGGGNRQVLQKYFMLVCRELDESKWFYPLDRISRTYDFLDFLQLPSAVRAELIAASCSGKTVRRSSRTRPSSTRAMMGGSEARMRATKSARPLMSPAWGPPSNLSPL